MCRCRTHQFALIARAAVVFAVVFMIGAGTAWPQNGNTEHTDAHDQAPPPKLNPPVLPPWAVPGPFNRDIPLAPQNVPPPFSTSTWNPIGPAPLTGGGGPGGTGVVSGRISGIAVDPTNNKDRKSTRLNSSHVKISYAVFCLKKKKR